MFPTRCSMSSGTASPLGRKPPSPHRRQPGPHLQHPGLSRPDDRGLAGGGRVPSSFDAEGPGEGGAPRLDRLGQVDVDQSGDHETVAPRHPEGAHRHPGFLGVGHYEAHPIRRHGQHHPGRALTEQGRVVGQAPVGNGEADAALHGHLGQGDTDAAVGDIMDPVEQPIADQPGHQLHQPGMAFQVERRQGAAPVSPRREGPQRAAQARVVLGPDQQQVVTSHQGDRRWGRRQVLDQAEDGNDGGGVDVAPPALVVQADVAPDDGNAERQARLGHAVDGLGELPHDLGVFRVAEVQAVDQGHRASAHAGHVERRFGHHQSGAGAGVEGTPATVAVRGQGHASARGRPGRRRRQPGRLQAQQDGVAPRGHHRVQEQLVVVLPVHPRRVDQHGQQVGAAVVGRGEGAGVAGGHLVERRGPRHGPVVTGRVLVEAGGRDIGQDLAVPTVEDPQAPPGRHPANHRGPHLPLGAARQDRGQVVGRDNGDHPFLALAGHDLEGQHGRFPQGHRGHVDVHPDPAARRRLAGSADQPRPAQVLDADHEVAIQQLQARLDEPLLLERVADLDVGPFGRLDGGVVAEPRGCQHAHAADPVAAGGGTEQDREIAGTRRPAEDQPVHRQDAQAQHVDQGVVGVALVKDQFPAHGGDADGVAVPRDPTDHPGGDPAAVGIVEGTETQWVHGGDGPGTHGEDVPQDPAHPRRGPLVGLDRGGVIVALDPQRNGNPIAGVDHAGVLTGAHQHVIRLGRQAGEVNLR